MQGVRKNLGVSRLGIIDNRRDALGLEGDLEGIALIFGFKAEGVLGPTPCVHELLEHSLCLIPYRECYLSYGYRVRYLRYDNHATPLD